ncbi:hypothetical protein GCM10023340_42220 [Nocardioides marinquilinus]|uniref:Uncharacterized protein n=1 Tax=Nocardioides marinquilinus TaxID=1210400 RepID=A0ABP9Q4V3_9ACTN
MRGRHGDLQLGEVRVVGPEQRQLCGPDHLATGSCREQRPPGRVVGAPGLRHEGVVGAQQWTPTRGAVGGLLDLPERTQGAVVRDVDADDDDPGRAQRIETRQVVRASASGSLSELAVRVTVAGFALAKSLRA